MRLTLENIIVVLLLILSEAWFLKGYFSGSPDFEPAIVFLTVLGSVFAKDKIKEKLGIGGQSNAHNQALFEDFLRKLPTEPTLRLLKETDFGDSFPRIAIQPLFNFVETWDYVDKEFLSKRLENERKRLLVDAKELSMEFDKHTVPVGDGNYLSVFPDTLRGSQRPEHVLKSAKILNEKSTAFVQKYESFIRKCKVHLAT